MDKKMIDETKPSEETANKIKVTKEKMKFKKILIISLSIIGVGALSGAVVGICNVFQSKSEALEFNINCNISDITLSNKRVIKGKDYITEININEEKINLGYTLPTSLDKVLSGKRELKKDIEPIEYIYILKENNKKADFKIPGDFIDGDISIELNLVAPDLPKEKHNVYWYNYDGTLLQEDIDIEEGTIPTYNGDAPTNFGDEKTKMTWSGGWNHDPEPVAKSDQTYIAKFEPTPLETADFFMGIDLTKEELSSKIELKYEYDGEVPIIDWGDNSLCDDSSSNVHTYKKIGQYGIRIKGNITSISLLINNGYATLSSLKEIYLGDSIINLPEHAFINCMNLCSVRYGDNPTIKTIGDSCFGSCPAITELFIPSSVESIGMTAFFPGPKGVSNVEKIIFGTNSNLTTIGVSAFSNSMIELLELPSKLQTIGDGAFYNCKNLTSLTINSEVKVGASAFYSCKKLKEVDLTALDNPPTLKSEAFEYKNFDDCDESLTFYVKDDTTKEKFEQVSGWEKYYDRIKVK